MINEIFRHEVCRQLTKSGNFSGIRKSLETIVPTLDKVHILEFYCYLRDNSMRWESEWREEFLDIFYVSNSDLPEISGIERWAFFLHELVKEGDLSRVKAFIEKIEIPSWTFEAEEESPTINFNIYPLDEMDCEGVVPSEKARILGYFEIAGYLEEVRKGVSDRYHNQWQKSFGKK